MDISCLCYQDSQLLTTVVETTTAAMTSKVTTATIMNEITITIISDQRFKKQWKSNVIPKNTENEILRLLFWEKSMKADGGSGGREGRAGGMRHKLNT